jgi:DNA mismatch repair protein MSH6
MGFFKKSTNSPGPAPTAATPAKKTPLSTLSKISYTKPTLPATLTPQPSSDAPQPSSQVEDDEETPTGKNKENGLLSPVTPSEAEANRGMSEVAGVAMSSPSRKVSVLTCYA